MVMRIIGGKATYGSDAQDAGGLIRRTSVKIMLGQPAHQSVAPKKKRECFNDSSLAAIVRSN
jgi:hypothetical protein